MTAQRSLGAGTAFMVLRPTLSPQRVTFVTFNYDRTLEAYFQRVIQNSFAMDATQALELRKGALPIIHLHGEIADAPFGYFEEAAIVGEIKRYASGIKVIHGRVPTGDPSFEAARQAIAQATLICFLGFGYHPVNLQRLAIHQTARTDAEIFGSTYRMGPAEKKNAERNLSRPIKGAGPGAQCERFLRDAVLLT